MTIDQLETAILLDVVKHAACANEAWPRQMVAEKPPARCDLGGPNPAKTKAEILSYLHDSFTMIDKVAASIGIASLSRAWLWEGGAHYERTYYGFDARADALLVGCLLAVCLFYGLAPQKTCCGARVVHVPW
jgi:hypothetical protein